MAATIKDVARLAGVSPSTVSRTCKDHPSISPKTKEKVRQAMQELGYEPNFQAGNLATRNSRTIGTILPPAIQDTFANPFYLEILRGIGEFCNQNQYMNTIVTGENTDEIIQAIRSMYKSGQADGFILLYSRQKDPIASYLKDSGLLFAVIGKGIENANQIIYIDNDNVLAARDATNYLIEKGHTRIACLSGDQNELYIQDRKNGFSLSMIEHRLSFDQECFLEQPSTEEGTPLTKQLEALLQSKEPPTAMLVTDDILAMALERSLAELGIKIPDQLSVISFNNSLFAKLASPQLTSMDINPRQLGIQAARQVIHHMENPNMIATKIIVPHHIVERDSCRER